MKRSLRFHAFAYAGVFSVLIVLAAIAVLFQVNRHIGNLSEDDLSRTLTDKARVISQLVRFYRGVAERIATEPETIEHVLFDDPARAEQWSVSIRRRLPGVIGVALFTEDGTILGDAPSQRVGPECLADMRKLAAGQSLPGPPVHRNVPKLSHFDVVVPVTQQERRIGLVFLSISLATIEPSLKETTAVNEIVTVYDASGEILVSAGRPMSGGNILNESISIPGTDWTLNYDVQQPPMRDIYISFVGMTALTIIVVCGAMIVLVSLAVRRLTGDLTTIKEKLQTLESGDAPQSSNGAVHLRETEALLPALDRIADVIHKRQQQLETLSETDALTGLPNRRAFESNYLHFAGMARRGTSVALGLIDIDFFKPINDDFGHDTGDEVLRRLSAALRHCLRASDFVARVGGDEFVVLLVDMSGDALPDWFVRLRTLFQSDAPDTVPPEKLSLSAGFALLESDRETPRPAALKRADEALYDAKAAGRARCHVAGTQKN